MENLRKIIILTAIMVFVSLSSLYSQSYEIFTIEPAYNSFTGVTNSSIGVQYYNTDFKTAILLTTINQSVESLELALGVFLSGEWKFNQLFIKLKNKIIELQFVSQRFDYSNGASTHGVATISLDILEKMKQAEEDVSARIVYTGFGEPMNLDIMIPQEYIHSILQQIKE